jgi:hypothetical protein
MMDTGQGKGGTYRRAHSGGTTPGEEKPVLEKQAGGVYTKHTAAPTQRVVVCSSHSSHTVSGPMLRLELFARAGSQAQSHVRTPKPRATCSLWYCRHAVSWDPNSLHHVRPYTANREGVAGPSQAGWGRVGQGGAGWGRVGQGGAGWGRVGQGGAGWGRVGQSGAGWGRVGQCGVGRGCSDGRYCLLSALLGDSHAETCHQEHLRGAGDCLHARHPHLTCTPSPV